jgi:peptidoglycan-associated lipoprotein
MTQRIAISLAVVAALTTVTACGGKKRPPAVTGTGTTVSRPSPSPDPGFGTGGTTAPTGTDDFSPITEGTPTLTDWDPTASEGQGPLVDIYFGYDQAGLTEEARGTLEKHALWLQNHRDAKVVVEGHCDERGTVEYNLALYNLALGEQRARAAHDYLKSLGIAEDRLRIVSFGKEKPLDPGHDESAWARNRRAHFTLTR